VHGWEGLCVSKGLMRGVVEQTVRLSKIDDMVRMLHRVVAYLCKARQLP
jgi:hypothetical protein